MTSKDKNYKFIERFRSFLTGLGKNKQLVPLTWKITQGQSIRGPYQSLCMPTEIPKRDDKFPKEKSTTVKLVQKSSMSDLSNYRVYSKIAHSLLVYSQLQAKRRPRINYTKCGVVTDTINTFNKVMGCRRQWRKRLFARNWTLSRNGFFLRKNSRDWTLRSFVLHSRRSSETPLGPAEGSMSTIRTDIQKMCMASSCPQEIVLQISTLRVSDAAGGCYEERLRKVMETPNFIL